MKKIYILIFCMAILFRIYAIEHKNFIHHDEPFTYFSSTIQNLSPDGTKFKKDWTIIGLETNKDFSAKEVKKSLFESKSKNITNDLKAIRSNNIDIAHPILYYSLLRIWNSGLDGTNPQKCIIRGGFLNLILFTLSFFFMYKLLSLIKPDDIKFIGLGLFFAFCSTAGISNTLLVREYALAEPFFILACYLCVIILKRINDNKTLSVTEILGYSLIFALFALTGYFQVLFLGLIFAVLIGKCLIDKRIDVVKQILVMTVLSLTEILIIYPDYFLQVINNPYLGIINSKIHAGIFYKNNYFHYIFYLPVIFAILLCSLFSKNKKYFFDKYLISIIIMAIIYNIAIMILTPIGNIRFILPSCAVLSLILVFFTYPLKKYCIIAITGLYLVLSAIPLINGNSYFSKIDFLYGDNENYKNLPLKFSEKLPPYPVVIHIPENHYGQWFYIYYIFFKVNNNSTVRFEKDLPDKNFMHNRIILIANPLSQKDYQKYLGKFSKTEELMYMFFDPLGHFYINDITIK